MTDHQIDAEKIRREHSCPPYCHFCHGTKVCPGFSCNGCGKTTPCETIRLLDRVEELEKIVTTVFEPSNKTRAQEAIDKMKCNCASIPPTIPTCRSQHLDSCPVSTIYLRGRLLDAESKIKSLEALLINLSQE